MTRTAAATALAVLFAGLVLGTTPATAQQPPSPCQLHRWEGETVQHFSKRRITCAVQRFGPVPGGATRAICIARRESGLDPSATSEPTGQYRGLYQHDRGMWPDRYDEYIAVVGALASSAERPHQRDRHDPDGQGRRLVARSGLAAYGLLSGGGSYPLGSHDPTAGHRLRSMATTDDDVETAKTITVEERIEELHKRKKAALTPEGVTPRRSSTTAAS